jgi:membrane-bound serine protease (ClpP class)
MELKDHSALIGKIAITDTDLSPKGTVIIDDEVYEAEAEDGYVEAGRGVRVTKIRGKKIYIRRV